MKLKKYLLFLLWSLSFITSCLTQTIQLASSDLVEFAVPQFIYDSPFFEGTDTIKLDFRQEEASIIFSFNEEIVNDSRLPYSEPIILKETTTINAQVTNFHGKKSEIKSVEFIKLGKSLRFKTLNLKEQPHENYQGKGVITLIDRKKGSMNFKDENWLGFLGKNVEFRGELEKHQTLSKMIVSILLDTKSWIFPPQKIELWLSNDGENYSKIVTQNCTIPTTETPADFQYFHLNFPPKKVKFFKLILPKLTAIPAWHPGKGNAAWLFLDEVILK